MVQGACQPATNAPPTAPVPLAPFWHTRALILLLLMVAGAGAMLDPRASSPAASSRLAGSYLPLLLVNLALVAYTAGLGLGLDVFSRLRERVHRLQLGRALCWALALFALVLSSESLLQSWLGMPESLAAHALLPQGLGEKAIWVVLATLIGGAEELVYRGYLRQQLAALSGSRAFGILLQALLFGVAHGQQGPWAVARFAVYGIAFGCIAERERSILPCALCHIGLDVYAGLAS